jgi:hypothetical protein
MRLSVIVFQIAAGIGAPDKVHGCQAAGWVVALVENLRTEICCG